MFSPTSLIQKVFFKNVKMTPSKRWVHKAVSLGQYERFNVARSGKRIACYRITPRVVSSDEDAPVVLFSHPISRKAKYFFSETGRASTYLDKGFTVFAFDYNGFGESESIDLYYWCDVAAVLDYLKIQFPQRRIILHGTSFGAFHMIRALQNLPLNSFVVLENVNKSLLSYWRRWPKTAILVQLLQWMKFRPVLEMNVRNIVKSFTRTDLHIQFIACENDDLTTLAEMRELYDELATPNKRFTVFNGAGHLAAPTKDPALYQSVLFSRGS